MTHVPEPGGYVPRRADRRIAELFSELPALMITGPRAAGKTTSASRHARTIVRLDRPAEAAAFRADPDAALASMPEPVLLDEWQEVPEILGAVKRSIDRDSRPARFLLTGSVRNDLTEQHWPGTGRVVRLTMFGMTAAELLQSGEQQSLPARILSGDAGSLQPSGSPLDLVDYLELASRSGFPEPALNLSQAARTAWLSSYLDQLVTRDAALGSGRRRDPVRLRRYFDAVALASGTLMTEQTLLEAAGIDRTTSGAYFDLLRDLLVVDEVPSWHSNRLSRLVKRPKRHVVDAALMLAAMRADTQVALRDGELLGRTIDTFVTSQLRAELAIDPSGPTLHHVRDGGGRHEVDLIIDLGARGLIGIEIKAGATPTRRDARHLTWLRDALGERFCGGVVLHTGPQAYPLDDRIIAAPISAIWS